jgi:hypothetical protein
VGVASCGASRLRLGGGGDNGGRARTANDGRPSPPPPAIGPSLRTSQRLLSMGTGEPIRTVEIKSDGSCRPISRLWISRMISGPVGAFKLILNGNLVRT